MPLGFQGSRLSKATHCGPPNRILIFRADEIARALKIDPTKFSDSFALTVGQTGAAHAGLMLSAALLIGKQPASADLWPLIRLDPFPWPCFQ